MRAWVSMVFKSNEKKNSRKSKRKQKLWEHFEIFLINSTAHLAQFGWKWTGYLPDKSQTTPKISFSFPGLTSFIRCENHLPSHFCHYLFRLQLALIMICTIKNSVRPKPLFWFMSDTETQIGWYFRPIPKPHFKGKI